jgi:rhodanese-related sulfurtransferase
MAELIDARALRAWLHDGKELALIDVREGGPFSRAHLLLASSLRSRHAAPSSWPASLLYKGWPQCATLT